MEPLLGQKEGRNSQKGGGAGISLNNDGHTSDEGSGGEDLPKISMGQKSVSFWSVRPRWKLRKIVKKLGSSLLMFPHSISHKVVQANRCLLR
jgi:hypothetical protein